MLSYVFELCSIMFFFFFFLASPSTALKGLLYTGCTIMFGQRNIFLKTIIHINK